MRKIDKSQEPISLINWKRREPNQTYRELKNDKVNGVAILREIRNICISEQYHLCAYCCDRISLDTCHNEHIQSQDSFPQFSLNHNNIVASCNNQNHCGHNKNTDILNLTPLMIECETELKFYLSGSVEGLTDRAKETIKILGIDNKALVNKRKQIIENLIYSNGEDPNEIRLLEEELLSLIVDDIMNLDENNKLESFSPILANVLKSLL